MKFYVPFLITFFFSIACNKNNIKQEYEIPLLKENINAYISAKKCFNESIEILLVNLDIKSDTLYLEIANTYPNVNKLSFSYDTVINGYRTIFTGERIKGYYNNSLRSGFPSDIIEINKEKKWLLFKDYTNWLFIYHSQKLIKKSLGCS